MDAFVEEVQRRFARATNGAHGEHNLPVVGVVVAYGGEIAWSDIFASTDLFYRYWHKLLRSYAVEALARPTLRETASLDEAREFLRRPNGRELQETEAGVYRWREVTQGKLALIELELPEWQVRRLAYDDGEWYCALSRERELPDWLDQSVEGRHADLALAILSAFIEVQRLSADLPRTSVPRAPQAASGLYEPLLSDNFG